MAKVAGKIPRDKLCTYIICPKEIRSKHNKILVLKAVTMIDTIKGWFEITQYDDNK